MSRRALLRAGALAAGAATLAGCGETALPNRRPLPGAAGHGSATDDVRVPRQLHEAPQLARKVRSGDLPPVTERLPRKPYVVPHRWLRSGNYGGDLVLAATATDDPQIGEYMYGHSPLRWLNDGADIGPGLAHSWEANHDATRWTFHFREGLKWSDGAPWSTADIMFWWDDLVLNEEHTATPPDELRSGKGTVAKLHAPDDLTLVVTFDAPAPVTADRMASYTNGGIGDNGPIWMLPKHYLKQFHPRYNPQVAKDWAAAGGEFETHSHFARNPECPTMTGWRLAEYSEGQDLIWERNPYYWCVGPDGAQLPYIDTVTMLAVQDQEVNKLQISQGRLDYAHGPFVPLLLGDVSSITQAQDRNDMRVLLWNSGSGTGSMFFFNYDHPDEKLRSLIREPKFRQALSLAVDRSEIQRSIYYTTGEPTTGTFSPSAREYANRRGPSIYQQWRDSYVDHDPARATRMLDELGVVDRDHDGFRELPDGGPLKVSLDYPADTSDDHLHKNSRLARDWNAIGIDTTQNPVSPEAFEDYWTAGKLMSRTAWELSSVHSHMVSPMWLIPIEATRWAPVEGQFYNVRGTKAEHTERDVPPYKRSPPRMAPEKGGPVEKLWHLYDRAKIEPDPLERERLVWEMIKVHISDGPFFMGTVGNSPVVIVAHKDLRNVPHRENLAHGGLVNPWGHPTPAVYDPEAYFWANPGDHTVATG